MINKKIEVIAKGTSAKIILKERNNNCKWINILEDEGFIGKMGLGKKKEGDNKTPIGIFKLGIAFGIKDNPGTELEYIKINKNMYWVGDSHSKFYNRLVEIIDDNRFKNDNLEYIQIYKREKDWKTAEHLIKQSVAYKYAINIEYNEKCESGKGSAIFLHCSEEKPTSGCISMSDEKMKELLINVDKSTVICIY